MGFIEDLFHTKIIYQTLSSCSLKLNFPTLKRLQQIREKNVKTVKFHVFYNQEDQITKYKTAITINMQAESL